MAEFTVDGHDYTCRKINALTQAKLVKRLAPLVGSIRDIAIGGIEKKDIFSQVGPLLEAVSKLPDDDIEFIFSHCLGACHRKDGSGWAPVWREGAAIPQYSDIELPQMAEIAWNVLVDNLANFFIERLPN